MNNLFNTNGSIQINRAQDVKENVLAGILGAFLFSLAGAIAYCVMYYLGFIASISGVIGILCAIKGYAIFAKKESIKGVIIAIVMTLISIAIGWYICFAGDIYTAAKEWYANGDIDFEVSFVDALSYVPLYLFDPEIGLEYLGDLALGILFAIMGGGGYAVKAFKGVNAKKAAETAKAVSGADDVSFVSPEPDFGEYTEGTETSNQSKDNE